MPPKEPKTYTQAELESAVNEAVTAAVTAAADHARNEATVAERGRVRELHACCRANRMESLFMGMVEEGASLTSAGRRIQDILALRDEETEITSRHHTGHYGEDRPPVNTAAIYENWGGKP